MDDLVAFLAARLDEDEAAARAAEPFYEDRDLVSEMVHIGFDAEVPQHAERHDPARVLREIAAKRAILAEMSASWRQSWTAAFTTLYAIAAVWSDHPGYRQEWALSTGG